MKIFLTGSNGFIGGHLLPRLKNLGHDVVTDMKYLEKDKYDLVIHLAAVTKIDMEFDGWLIELNIILAKKMLRTPYRTIYASSCSAAHLTNPYAYTKRYSEWLGAKHGNALGLRFHNVYGPNNHKGIVKFLMDQPDGAKVTIRGPGLVRDYIHVDDVVNCILNKLSPQNPVYIDMEVLQETAKENKLRVNELVKLAFEQNIYLGHRKYITGSPNVGIMDVGTGIGTTTMQLVEKYMQVSGKRFEIERVLPGSNEPLSMISNNPVPHMTLETGLNKTIESEAAHQAGLTKLSEI